MDNSFQLKHKEELDKVVTMGVLLEFTDEFLMPKVFDAISASEKRMMLEMGKLNHDLKVYIDEKLGSYTSDIFTRLDKKYAKEKQFKDKLLEVLKKHNIGSAEDMAYLEGLAA